ncbi:hypothetical protein RND81_01G130600 [Saponaria officinalis]|uniref:Pectinesterase inhibitor domain-containing protein n=1 Tax=Saponaria officinalis TaxID=3572 RepID=A0AAW1N7F9_SAPOF
MSYFLLQIIILLTISTFPHPTKQYDPKNPPKPVKDVCNRIDDDKYGYCIAVFNTGSVENGDMRFLAYYARDLRENNATNAMQRINSDLMPRIPDPYVQQVLWVCKDAFEKVKEELVNRVNPMITSGSDFQEAKAWVNYCVGLMYSCRAVCMGYRDGVNALP